MRFSCELGTMCERDLGWSNGLQNWPNVLNPQLKFVYVSVASLRLTCACTPTRGCSSKSVDVRFHNFYHHSVVIVIK